jgi:hypothetical protein
LAASTQPLVAQPLALGLAARQYQADASVDMSASADAAKTADVSNFFIVFLSPLWDHVPDGVEYSRQRIASSIAYR